MQIERSRLRFPERGREGEQGVRSVAMRGVLFGTLRKWYVWQLLDWFIVSACASVPIGPLTPGELRLLKIKAPDRIRAGDPYEVVITCEADGAPEIRRACFFWSGATLREGPYCFPIAGIRPGATRTFTVNLRTRNPRIYTLEGYAEYLRGGRIEKSNEVGTVIEVR